ncbi:MAG TPA: helix-turn-helix domain-containing protein [Candidatus Limiplasma sp.]|nr:helix-turn-helix domain-containing protein [Candidatus Limiplasma sp.]
MKAFTRKRGAGNGAEPESAVRIALSYGVFLLICLGLGLGLYLSVAGSAKDDYWSHHSALLSNNVVTMDHYLATVDSYTRQLTNDSTFIRFSNMKSLDDYGYITTADTIMQTLSSRAFSLANVPITESHIYLKNTKYIISSSQFTEVRQFYMDYNIWKKDQYQNWLNMLTAATGDERNYDTSAYSGVADQYTLVRDIDDIFTKTIPAIIWFDWDMDALTRQFLGHIEDERAILVAVSPENKIQLVLYGSEADADDTARLKAYALAMKTEETLGAYHVLCEESTRNSWRYYLAVPEALCAQSMGCSNLLFTALFLVVLLGGIFIIALRVRHIIQPIRQLGSRLELACSQQQQLELELNSHKPFLYTSYLRRMLSGHVASEDEFKYMLHFFGIDGEGLRYMVLYCSAYAQNEQEADTLTIPKILSEEIAAALQTAYPAYSYTTLDKSFVTLVTYGPNVDDPLMDLQTRVVKLHDELLARHNIWFYAGVGTLCTHPMTLWESFEQARAASRYASRSHVFLPYEVIGKKTADVYYPIEISAKLLHFITTGNTQQVQEMFQLIYRENFTERSLPLNMLNYLLSDIRNTLMRARFSVPADAAGDGKALRQIDEYLAKQATLPLCESIAVELCRFFSETAKPADPIPEIREYLKKNYGDPSICLSMLSNQFHISESYLSHLFKEKTGENFSVHLENLRLKEAAKRLKNPERYGNALSINSLYLEVGYNSAVTFRRAFKKRFGMTPSEMSKSGK